MLESIYVTMFRPGQSRETNLAGIVIALLAILVMTLNVAGRIHLGAVGVALLYIVFLLAGCLGWYWLSVSVYFIAQLLGGRGQGITTFQAIARGLWPLLLTGPAIAAAHWSQTLGSLFSLGVTMGLALTLTAAIRQAHQLRWLQAFLCLLISANLSFLAIGGLVLWPLMLFLGT